MRMRGPASALDLQCLMCMSKLTFRHMMRESKDIAQEIQTIKKEHKAVLDTLEMNMKVIAKATTQRRSPAFEKHAPQEEREEQLRVNASVSTELLFGSQPEKEQRHFETDDGLVAG
eukprot:gnl/TRDRNA2_/TRDRNA2_143058_c2_seq1.p1 gnl/TRDRNA2_/TRDRNA2_143058_c2~~gnl/TRDRNA2_/TRDRNA2_143058_c2_seq1.p1  ORF type:complete len:116 (-),score=26.75 gnl/TRDRNA2_/TRDRNA2_143058_c2_seq1:50-397(-)